ncbi:hypothetical protein O0L34_g5211 [Tuta absoluta]|nr:hypothetical protein O0L34_g5211 [Tuta absoluta]
MRTHLPRNAQVKRGALEKKQTKHIRREIATVSEWKDRVTSYKVTVLPKLQYCRVVSRECCGAGGAAYTSDAVDRHLCSLRVPCERERRGARAPPPAPAAPALSPAAPPPLPPPPLAPAAPPPATAAGPAVPPGPFIYNTTPPRATACHRVCPTPTTPPNPLPTTTQLCRITNDIHIRHLTKVFKKYKRFV